ncbi:ATP phosphoribosyltransferase regulatory subunit [Acetobacter sp. AN02]|uniref:ATP phosphoribosyltransferase regulatory subunit n=1 Tax=Acetobacter sp. AN02 TaxID=2894186 RepID=UPI0024344E79|nr:ATP phosphoribosyltransferase regulatory subunit [Acetobacter sp. AN02]MDG6094098.1 ATP phosphoribosyltransferase regulatory subunit [Acetobacter sp. AN02]
MTDSQSFNLALLPAGFTDLLPRDAQAEADGTETLMSVFASHGYERVRPPLLEFEETLLSGSGAAVAGQAFRIMDPDTRRMMVLRPDITPQIARIASTRMAATPRPLRLSYAGMSVLTGGSGARETGRQIGQTGIELIGPDSVQADAEIVAVTAEAIARLGVTDVSFDLTMPLLAPAIIKASGLGQDETRALMHALDRKDAAGVAAPGGEVAEILTRLLQAAGPADQVLAELERAVLPDEARSYSTRLAETVREIRRRLPALRLTIDPVEFRGWKYHTGVCFSVYAAGSREELGRGGRYLCMDNEPACGLTLRPDALFRVAVPRKKRMRVFISPDASEQAAERLREEGYATLAALEPVADVRAEALRLACSHILQGDSLNPVG